MPILFFILLILVPSWAMGQTENSAQYKPLDAVTAGKSAINQSSDKIDVSVREVVLLPEVAQIVNMSNTDFTRIKCDDLIQDIIPSREKTVTTKFTGNNAFIKFKYLMRDGKPIYASKPVELDVVCSGDIFRIIANPKNMTYSPLIRLSSGKKDVIKENASLFGGMPLVRKCIKLVQLAYKDSLPSSFDVSRLDTSIRLFKDLKLTLRRIVSVGGEGLQLKEFEAVNASDNLMRLTEKMFLNDKLTSKTLWVSLSKLNISPGDRTRLFIVEQNGGAK